ncbi:amidase, hydantoinase/carbamoylase family protein [Bordetella holmesii 30539]|nr:amidase, hydantoinase/carbamoylase family protein [Bordetella holmesii 44057]EXF88211.1 amidase, hydantoinase/carbamoylase family protein [Bordetella holmesii 30539]EXX94214.1 amidase, hydantoinase/carbamoylase family protein [Bordetella holmesii 1058]SUV94802.1 allantoate amidohydrolase [Bordetella holmesii]
MMGSGVFAGKFSLETALSARDAGGTSVAQELRAIGYAGDDPVGGRPVGAYFEAHIEQGPILEHESKTVGVVTGSLGVRWYDVTITGMEMHAGPTPMAIRKDALYAASFLVQAVVELARANAPHGRGTVGEIHAHPGSRNVIPGQVRMTVDLRHQDEATLANMDRQWLARAAQVAREHAVEIDVRQVQYFPPTPFDPELVGWIREAAQQRDLPAMDIVTGAGHDAVYMASVTPTAMIFVPCKDGISHNEIEDAKPADLEAGANVLLDAMLARANTQP